MTTRYGFEGGEPGGPPAAEKPRLAKTVFGRDVHLPCLPGQPPVEAPPKPAAHEPRVSQATRLAGSKSNPQLGHDSTSPTAPSPLKATPARLIKQTTQNASKSARPGVARFLGRRNTHGDIVPLTQTDVLLPTRPWLGPAVTVVVAALASFLLVATLLWLFGPKAAQRPAPAAAVRTVAAPPPPVPSAPPIVAQPAPPEVLPAPAPEAAPPVTPRPKAKAVRGPAAPRRSRPPDPDAPLPPTFF